MFLIFCYLILSWSFSLHAEKEGSLRMPKELEHAEIVDKRGAKIPFDVMITNQNNRQIMLGDYFSNGDKRPVLLTLGYYGCPMLCSLVLNGMVDALKQLDYKLGEHYRIASVSIDEREKPELAKQKQQAYLSALGMPSAVDDWQFFVTDKNSSRRLADAVGFDYSYSKKNDEFSHGAGIFILTPQGILSATLYGIQFSARDVRLALNESSDGKIGSFIDRIILSCFHYDPDSHRYGFYIMGIMRLGGIATVLVLGIVLLLYFRKERHHEGDWVGNGKSIRNS